MSQPPHGGRFARRPETPGRNKFQVTRKEVDKAIGRDKSSNGAPRAQPSTASNEGYATNPAAGRNTYPAQQYQHNNALPFQQEAEMPQIVDDANGVFDETIASNFEDTKSLTVDGREYAYEQGYEDHAQGYTDRDEVLSDEPPSGQQPMSDGMEYNGTSSPPSNGMRLAMHSGPAHVHTEYAHRIQPKSNNISGRFSGHKDHQSGQSFPSQPPESVHDQRLESKKRGRSTEQRYNVDEGRQLKRESQHQQPVQVNTPISLHNQNNGNHMGSDVSDPESVTRSDDILEEQVQAGQSHTGQLQIDQKRTEQERDRQEAARQQNLRRPDYDDTTLGTMTYKDLKNATWDKEITSGQGIGSLEDRLKKLIQKNHPQGQEDARDEEQSSFFASLSLAEWEEAGDLFIDRFTDIMKRIREARKNKREMVAKFEKDIENREAAVRGKSENLDTKLANMKTGGMSLLGDNNSGF